MLAVSKSFMDDFILEYKKQNEATCCHLALHVVAAAHGSALSSRLMSICLLSDMRVHVPRMTAGAVQGPGCRSFTYSQKSGKSLVMHAAVKLRCSTHDSTCSLSRRMVLRTVTEEPVFSVYAPPA